MCALPVLFPFNIENEQDVYGLILGSGCTLVLVVIGFILWLVL